MTNYSLAIKALREDLLLTQEEFAQKIGVAFATINRWENGHHEPSLRYKRKIKSLCLKHGIKVGE